MPERYVQAIMKYLAGRDYQPLKPRQLARQLGVAGAEYDTFRDAVKSLRDSGQVVLGAGNALTLPQMASRVAGIYRANPRGFGFVIPQTPNAHGDLYIPQGAAAGAMTGDEVLARVRKRGKRGGEMIYHGEVVNIIRRGASRLVGTLQVADGAWFVMPDGRGFTQPVVIADVGPSPKPGRKVVAEIVKYPAPGQLARGVIVEDVGAAGHIEAETLSVIRAHGLPDEFDEEVLAEARAAVDGFDPGQAAKREDLTAQTIITIDPPDARDFDDAIGIAADGDALVLGVHIADVSHFVPQGGRLDTEARQRGNSVYFPRKVLPMLPEVLANGVCSLQEGQRRFCKSAFIRYDAGGNATGARLAETVIASAKRLTYAQAQGVIDGQSGGYDPKVVQLLRRMNELARKIEIRRRAAGMIHLDLPAVELVLDDEGKVVDAAPEDDSYTHTIIEMFMVEANEAAAAALDRAGAAYLRRIHPEPDPAGGKKLASFVRVCGHKLPRNLTRKDMQQLLAAVKGRPESYAVNLAVLKSFEQAEYSPMKIGHFALASSNYSHFTSPIRRYPDLTVHRLLADVIAKRRPAPADMAELVALGEHCSATDRRAEAAGQELRCVLILQLLAKKIGDEFNGVVTGVTNFGLFVELPQYMIDGLVRLTDLGDDWWEVSAQRGEIRGQRTGQRHRIGDLFAVRILSVDLAARQLNLAPAAPAEKPKPKSKPKKAKKPRKPRP